MAEETPPHFFARVKYQIIITEEREMFIPVSDPGDFSMQDVIQAAEEDARHNYSRVKSESEEMRISNIKVTHEVMGIVPTNQNGQMITEKYWPLKNQ